MCRLKILVKQKKQILGKFIDFYTTQHRINMQNIASKQDLANRIHHFFVSWST